LRSCFVDALVPCSVFFSLTPLQLKLNFKEDESKGEISLVGIKEGKEVSRAVSPANLRLISPVTKRFIAIFY